MSDDSETVLVWFRRDLRRNDHPALRRAVECARTVVPVYVDRRADADWAPGPAKRWWLRRSVEELAEAFEERGLQLVVRPGPPPEALAQLAEETGADALLFNENLVPVGLDDAVEERLRDSGVSVRRFEARLLHDPDAIRTTSGGPYHVFTPFWEKFRAEIEVGEPERAPRLSASLAPESWPDSRRADALEEPPASFDGAPESHWSAGEAAARRRLERFADDLLGGYPDGRERPDRDATSRLSPHLHTGELSPRRVWNRVTAAAEDGGDSETAEAYLRQLAWREFSYHLLVHYPETSREPLREKFRDFGWRGDEESLQRWREGTTGYPLVDAGMRQLRETGWMHNRVRMVVASFLTKDLLIPWQQGAEWFWQRLVDADLANNTMGWQWAAGCGADAQPFFRIFNPVSQSERHDPEGTYIRRWIPEIGGLSDENVHAPWRADGDALKRAGVTLDDDYPSPIVDHSEARERALREWERIK